MIWLFFPFGFTLFISFLNIGARARQLKWIIAGIIYLLIVVNYFFYLEYYEDVSLYENISLTLVLIGWVVGFAHAVIARTEYLRIRAERIRIQGAKFNALNRNHSGQPSAISSHGDLSSIKRNKQSTESRSTSVTPKVVNVNKASKEELAVIPSINNILATQIIHKRNEIGSFQSFTHFISVMNMKPHILAKAKPYMKFSDEKKPHHPDENTEQNERKSSYSTGRIVDY